MCHFNRNGLKSVLAALVLVIVVMASNAQQSTALKTNMLAGHNNFGKYDQGKDPVAPLSSMHNRSSGGSGSKTIMYQWDTIICFDAADINYERYTQLLDINGIVQLRLKEFWLSNTWVNSDRNTYTYDLSGQLVTDLEEYWDGSNWQYFSRKTYTHDTYGHIVLYLTEYWQGSSWINGNLVSYIFSVNGNRRSCLDQVWANGVWQNLSKDTCNYDANGNLAIQTNVAWLNNAWTDINRFSYTYDMNGNMINMMVESASQGSWVDQFLYTYAYDMNNNLVIELDKVSNGTGWQIDRRVINSYDTYGNRLATVSADWLPGSFAWENIDSITYTHDANNNSVTGQYLKWQNGAWQSDLGPLMLYSNGNDALYRIPDAIYRYTATYGSFNLITGAQGNTPAEDLIMVTSHSENSSLSIVIPRPLENAALTIYDILGNKIFAKSITESRTVISTAGLPGGIYFLRVESSEGTVVKKFITGRQ
jgi:hypothetical protein